MREIPGAPYAARAERVAASCASERSSGEVGSERRSERRTTGQAVNGSSCVRFRERLTVVLQAGCNRVNCCSCVLSEARGEGAVCAVPLPLTLAESCKRMDRLMIRNTDRDEFAGSTKVGGNASLKEVLGILPGCSLTVLV